MQEVPVIDIGKALRNLRKETAARSGDMRYRKKTREKFEAWTGSLDILLQQIAVVEKIVIPKIETDTKKFRNRDLVLIALMQGSVKKLFRDIETEFSADPAFILSEKELKFLTGAHELALSLAWAGDSVIKYAILGRIWTPDRTTEQLNSLRQALETNKHLSIRCDRWMLYDHRIHLDETVPGEKKMERIKGTLTEAIFGIIYAEQGMGGVTAAIRYILSDAGINGDHPPGKE